MSAPFETLRGWRCWLVAALVLAGCNPDRLPPVPEEVDRPFLARDEVVDPAPQSIMVDPHTPVTVSFSEPMDLASFEGHMLVKRAGSDETAGTFTAAGASVVFRPAAPFDPATLYRVELRGRLKDAQGNSIERNGQPVLDDTTLLYQSWFFTDGPYADGGGAQTFVLDLRGRIWVVDDFAAETGTITEALGGAPRGLGRAAGRLVALDPSSSRAVIYDAASRSLAARVDVPRDPAALVTAGDRAYVVSAAGKAVTEIDVGAGAAVRTFSLDFFPGMIARSPDGARLFTLNQVTGDLVTLDAATGAVLATLEKLVRIPVTGEIAVHPATGQVAVADTRGDRLHVVGADGGTLLTSYDAGTVEGVWKPTKLAYTGDGDLLVVPQNTGAVYRLDLEDRTVVQTYPFEAPVKGLEVLEGGNPLLVLAGSLLHTIDIETGTLLSTVALVDANPDAVVTMR